MRMYKLIFLFFLASFLQSAEWVTVTGESYGENKTPEEARKSALQDAREKAIAEVVGIAIASQKIDLQTNYIDAFSSLSQSATNGKIIEEKIVRWDVENIKISKDKPPVLMYKVTLKAKVAKEEYALDPKFKLSVQLNNLSFREKEEMIIKIKSSKDAYITVFNILSNDTVIILFPNQFMKNNFLNADKVYEIPSREWREKGIHFRTGLPSGMDKVSEMIMVIGTKENIPFQPKELREWGTGVLPTYQDAITAVNRWLVSIPLNKRTSECVVYQIQR